MAINVDWWGAYGYGDIIHSLGYANTFAKKSGVEVNLNIHWDCGEARKFHGLDPETKLERFKILQDEIVMCHRVNVTHHMRSMGVVYNGISKVPSAGSRVLPRYKNVFDDTISLHALVEPKNHYSVVKNQICIWTPEYNINELHDWKDTLKGRWEDFRNIIEDQGFTIVEISYREPIKNAIKKVATSEYCVGYGGLGKGLAGLFWKPLVSITQRSNNTYRETPWAYPVSDEKTLHDLLPLFVESKRNIPAVLEDYHRYINNDALMLGKYVIQ
jgi:hypothetical protein